MRPPADFSAVEVDLPSLPPVLARMSALLAGPEVDLDELGRLIESDMALAAGVLRAANAALYGLAGRIQTVRQALTYLGTGEVAALTLAIGLRAAFPAAQELEPLWQRAALRGFLMGRLARALGLDSWVAHSAGLFEECGKAVLFRHATARYRPLLATAGDDAALLVLEHRAFGFSHDDIGAALCQAWGLAPGAVASVRHHVIVIGTCELPRQLAQPAVCALSALVHALMTAPQTLDLVALALAPPAGLDTTGVLRSARLVHEQLAAAGARGDAVSPAI